MLLTYTTQSISRSTVFLTAKVSKKWEVQENVWKHYKYLHIATLIEGQHGNLV